MRKCPNCEIALITTTFAEVHIDACATCGGYWFDNHELAWLTQRAPDRLLELEHHYSDTRGDESSSMGRRTCPSCTVEIVPYEFPHSPGIVMDICLRCHGIWLEDGKLTLIDRRLKQMKAAQPKPAAPPPASAPRPTPAPPATSAKPQVTPTGAAPNPVTATPPKPTPPLPTSARTAVKIAPSGPGARKCYKCGTMNKAEGTACEKCGASLSGAKRWKPGYCPRCHLGMYPARRSGFIIQACSRCEGIWLPRPFLQELLQQHIDRVKSLDTNFQLHYHTPEEHMSIHRCPDCSKDLVDENFYWEPPEQTRIDTDILTHRCPECDGVWFDAGEIHAVWRVISGKLAALST